MKKKLKAMCIPLVLVVVNYILGSIIARLNKTEDHDERYKTIGDVLESMWHLLIDKFHLIPPGPSTKPWWKYNGEYQLHNKKYALLFKREVYGEEYTITILVRNKVNDTMRRLSYVEGDEKAYSIGETHYMTFRSIPWQLV